MKNKPILLVAGEPNSIFFEILLFRLKGLISNFRLNLLFNVIELHCNRHS